MPRPRQCLCFLWGGILLIWMDAAMGLSALDVWQLPPI